MNKSLLDSISKVKEEKNVEEIYLFGSVARGDEDEYSDIDILIVIDDCTEDEYIDWKNKFSNYYKVNLYFNNKKIRLNGFLDTGNKLKDPYSGKPIIIVNEKRIKQPSDKFFLVPMKTVGGESFIKCFKIDELEIVGIGKKKNVLLGVTKTKIEMEGIDCILHQSLLEG